jgi:hypothetical protein
VGLLRASTDAGSLCCGIASSSGELSAFDGAGNKESFRKGVRMFTVRRRISLGFPVIALVVVGAMGGCGGGTKTVTASNTQSTTTSGTGSTAATSTPTSTSGAATPTSTPSPAAEAAAATACLKGRNAQVKQLTPGGGDYGIDAKVAAGPNPVVNNVRMVFTPSPTRAQVEFKYAASQGATPTTVGNNIIAYFEPPTQVNQQFALGCFNQAAASG